MSICKEELPILVSFAIRYSKSEFSVNGRTKTNCAHISTGHYCRLEERKGKLYIVAGDDQTKDQSYFLWKLPQEILQRFLFPLGTYTKQEVREYLRQKGFEAKARGGESMEICFIEGDYRNFLRSQCPDIDTQVGPGWFVNSKGVKIGQHKGFPYYTIGQRKGLEIALGHPAYVLRINAEKNTVMLGDAEELKAEYMLVEDYHITEMQDLLQCKDLSVRIRYRSKPIPCQVLVLDEKQLLVRFLSEASAIAPGQSAVFYEGKRVLGGAFIASQRGIRKIAADNQDKFLDDENIYRISYFHVQLIIMQLPTDHKQSSFLRRGRIARTGNTAQTGD